MAKYEVLFGIELERGWERDITDNSEVHDKIVLEWDWELKEDGSLYVHNREYIAKELASPVFSEKELNRFVKELREIYQYVGEENRSMGTHIHASIKEKGKWNTEYRVILSHAYAVPFFIRRIFEHEKREVLKGLLLKRLYGSYSSVYEYSYRATTAVRTLQNIDDMRRQITNTRLSVSQELQKLCELYEQKKHKIYAALHYVYDEQDRYVPVSLKNSYVKHRSVEFRIFPALWGTLQMSTEEKVKTIKGWVQNVITGMHKYVKWIDREYEDKQYVDELRINDKKKIKIKI